MGNGGVVGKLILFPAGCNCITTPVTDIEADLAFILLAPEIFARAISSNNGEMAMKIALTCLQMLRAISATHSY